MTHDSTLLKITARQCQFYGRAGLHSQVLSQQTAQAHTVADEQNLSQPAVAFPTSQNQSFGIITKLACLVTESK